MPVLDIGQIQDPDSMSDSDVHEAFLELCEREAPVGGVGAYLREFTASFMECASRVRWEHGFMRARYYTKEDGSPILNPFHIEHLTRLLQAFAYELYRGGKVRPAVLDCLFYIMRSKCGLNVFYRQKLTPFFLPRHALGTILGYGDWGPCLLITQGCTIGHNRGEYPRIGTGVILGPQSMVLGNSVIGDNVTLAAGAAVIDTKIPDNKIVFGRPPNLVIRDNASNNIDENYFADKIMPHLALVRNEVL